MLKENLTSVRELVAKSWCKDDLARDTRGKVSDQLGNLVEVRNKNGDVVSSDFYPAASWSVAGAMMLVSDSGRYPNKRFTEMLNAVMPAVRNRGYLFLHWFEGYQLIVRKKVVAQTTQEDVLAMLDEAIAAI